MQAVDLRNIRNIFFRKAVVSFLSKIIIKKLNSDSKLVFRKIEAKSKKYIKIEADINFLTFCLHNQLLPKFLNFKLYDRNAINEEQTINFKKSLLEREIKKKKEELKKASSETIELILNFKTITETIYFYSAITFLQKLIKNHKRDIEYRHHRKLKNIYGGQIILKENKDIITNLSTYQPNVNEVTVLNKGLNFGTKPNINKLFKKIQTEKLFSSIKNEETNKKTIEIKDEESLKTKLKTFSISHLYDKNNDPLTKEENNAIKSLKNNKDIVIQRPDKGRGRHNE